MNIKKAGKRKMDEMTGGEIFRLITCVRKAGQMKKSLNLSNLYPDKFNDVGIKAKPNGVKVSNVPPNGSHGAGRIPARPASDFLHL